MRANRSAPERAPAGDARLAAARRDVAAGAAAAGVVGLFVNLLHLALPLFMIQVYDRVLTSRSYETLTALALLVLLSLAFQGALDFLRHRIFLILGERFAHRVGPAALEAAVEAASARGGPAPGAAMQDVAALRTFIAGGAAALPLDLAATPAFLAVLFLLHPGYGAVAAAAAAAMIAAAVGVELAARRPATRAQRAAGAAQAAGLSALRGAEAITAMGMGAAMLARWRAAQRAALEAQDASQSRARALTTLARALRSGLQVAVVAVGAALVIAGETTAGAIIAASVVTGRLLAPYEQLIEGWRQWCDAAAAHGRLADLLETGTGERSTTPVAIESGRLVVDRVSFTPPGAPRPALRNVSVALDGGTFLGVLGPSASGKSTFARLLVGLWRPGAGGVQLDGHDVWRHERGAFGAAVGYLPQDPMLLEGTVRENIARMGPADPAEVVRAARRAGVHELIGALPRGYDTPLDDGGRRLSGGERQRIALARALFGDPRLVVLDEPNASLDAEGEAALMAAIDDLRAAGTTVVVVAQRMSILHRADSLLVLRDGAVAHLGPRAEVFAALGMHTQAAGRRRAAGGARP
jgi:ATP-binding cassette subfamily C protein